MKAFLSHRLGQYILNVTRAAEVCSDFLCQGNGRCIRRDPHAPHYLHLNKRSYSIRSTGNGDFAVTGWHSQHDLQLLTKRFRCHCYEGHEGESCDSINEVREDDESWTEGEDNEQEKRRTEWEYEQEEQRDATDNKTSHSRSGPETLFVMLLLNLLTVKMVY